MNIYEYLIILFKNSWCDSWSGSPSSSTPTPWMCSARWSPVWSMTGKRARACTGQLLVRMMAVMVIVVLMMVIGGGGGGGGDGGDYCSNNIAQLKLKICTSHYCLNQTCKRHVVLLWRTFPPQISTQTSVDQARTDSRWSLLCSLWIMYVNLNIPRVLDLLMACHQVAAGHYSYWLAMKFVTSTTQHLCMLSVVPQNVAFDHDRKEPCGVICLFVYHKLLGGGDFNSNLNCLFYKE